MVLISGGFDPLHAGHVEYIRRAAKLGPLDIALNSDAWLLRKKGYVFMPWVERRVILSALVGVRSVIPVEDSDGTVCEAIKRLRPTIFANGGDRGPDNTPEADLCAELGIRCVYGLGAKVQASSGLVNRNWGFYQVLYEDPQFKVKMLTVLPGRSTSMQKHFKRSEHWISPNNEYTHVPVGEWHQLTNDGNVAMRVIEVQTGEYFGEDDILRR